MVGMPEFPPVFIDTSALYAMADAHDAVHHHAQQHWERLIEEKRRLITTVAVASETATLIRRRLGFDEAQRWFEQLERARLVQALELIFIGLREYDLAREIFRSIGVPRLSFVDALSFAVMRLQGITTCFGFDEDFFQGGFELVGGEQP
jgi:predicted nucleic acid-binding protein